MFVVLIKTTFLLCSIVIFFHGYIQLEGLNRYFDFRIVLRRHLF
jgi:hypothetical protein